MSDMSPAGKQIWEEAIGAILAEQQAIRRTRLLVLLAVVAVMALVVIAVMAVVG